MIKIDSNTKRILIDLYNKKKIGLEGNITKIIDGENDEEFKKYLEECLLKDEDKRKKRLDMTKRIQKQNVFLATFSKNKYFGLFSFSLRIL